MEELKLLVELIAAIAWPAVVFYVLIAFRDPLRRAINQLPKKLGEASKVSVGSFSVEVQARLSASGDTEVIKALPDLTRGDLEVIISLRDTSHSHGLVTRSQTGKDEESYSLPMVRDMDSLQHLDSLKLMRFTEPLTDFLSFFKALPQSSHYNLPGRNPFVPKNQLNKDQIKRIESQAYSLTDTGRRVYDAIFSSVLQQLGDKS